MNMNHPLLDMRWSFPYIGNYQDWIQDDSWISTREKWI